jgi:hypothetical protein
MEPAETPFPELINTAPELTFPSPEEIVTLPLCSADALDATNVSFDPRIAATELLPVTAEAAPPTAPLPAITKREPPVLVASSEEPPTNETEPALPVVASAVTNVTSPDAPLSD